MTSTSACTFGSSACRKRPLWPAAERSSTKAAQVVRIASTPFWSLGSLLQRPVRDAIRVYGACLDSPGQARIHPEMGPAACMLLSLVSAAEERSVVAVFDIEAKDGAVDTETLDKLTSYLTAAITEVGFHAVPRVEIKARLVQAK